MRKTYELIYRTDQSASTGPQIAVAIRCLVCARVSHNANDVAALFCAHCDRFHLDYGARRLLADGRELSLLPLLTGVRLGIGRARAGAIDDVWDYTDVLAGFRAFYEWDGSGEPNGWTRHPGDGRRRPDGDPSREYVRD